MILVAIVCDLQLVKLLCENGKRVVLGVDADELDFIDVHFHRHHVGGVVEAGGPVRALVEAPKADFAISTSTLAKRSSCPAVGVVL